MFLLISGKSILFLNEIFRFSFGMKFNKLESEIIIKLSNKILIFKRNKK